MKTPGSEILVFTLDEQRFAIPLSCVVRVVRAMSVTQIPDVSPLIHGVIDYQGETITVLNMRSKLKLTDKDIKMNDRFIIANAQNRKIALVVDVVEGVVNPDKKNIDKPGEVNPGIRTAGILRDEKGIILLYDPERLLKTFESIQLKEIHEAAMVA